jgi:hypothetical protein
MAVYSRCSCRGLFKKLDILPVPCEYTFSLIMFAFNSLDNFQTKSVVHGMNTRAKHQLYSPTVNLSCIQKGVFHSSIKIFNSLPPCVLKLKQEKPKFQAALREILLLILFIF